MMKIALAQQNYHIGNFQANTDKVIHAIEKAKKDKVDIVVFSELCVCGYPPRDFLYFKDFSEKSLQAVQQIAAASQDIAVVIGAPSSNPKQEGKDLYNSAFFIANGKIESVIHKTCLPTYDVFDENRYFEPASEWNVVTYKGKKIALTICEDIWNLGDNPLYTICPLDRLIPQKPDFIINISASPFDYTHQNDRLSVVASNVRKYGIPLFYSNSVGSQTEIVFDGHSLAFDKNGNCCGQSAAFEEDYQLYHLLDDGSLEEPVLYHASAIASIADDPLQLVPDMNIENVHKALLSGIRDYFSKMGFSKAIIGSSGGIDSAVTLALAVEALGKQNVTAILMPSVFSSSHSVSDAEDLSRRLGNPYERLPIHKVNEKVLELLEPLFAGTTTGIAEENIQSRIRGLLLMAVANKKGFILLNTSNKSELATGYGTLYGDMAGGLGVLGDCYKRQVYALARYINREKEIIPLSIIEKAPSAELRPDQKDTDSLPEYELLDAILYQYIERQQGPQEIKSMGYDPALTDRILRLVNNNEYKRNQFCPIIRISPKAFGVGRRMPIVAKYLS